MGKILVGYEKVDITPSWETELVGFDREDNLSKGVIDNLYAQLLLFKDSENSYILVTIDSLGFTVELTNKLRELIASELDTNAERIMVCFSHTHSAPNLAVDRKYFNFVCEEILKGTVKASESKKACRAGWESTNCSIGINRRGKEEQVDSRMGILKIVSEDESFKLLILRVTAHGNVLSADNYLISSDYFGTTRDKIKRELNCEVMMVQGASGNIRPKYQQSNAENLEVHYYEEIKKNYTKKELDNFFKESMDALKKMADEIYQSLADVYFKIKLNEIEDIEIISNKHKFYADVPSLERAKEIGIEAYELAHINPKSWLEEVERLHSDNISRQESSIEVQYFLLNNGGLCGIPNEAMCEIALEIDSRLKLPCFFFNGYTNGTSSYLPTAEEYEKGGYEVLWSNLVYFMYHGRVMPLNKNTADEIIDIVVKFMRNYNIK